MMGRVVFLADLLIFILKVFSMDFLINFVQWQIGDINSPHTAVS